MKSKKGKVCVPSDKGIVCYEGGELSPSKVRQPEDTSEDKKTECVGNDCSDAQDKQNEKSKDHEDRNRRVTRKTKISSEFGRQPVVPTIVTVPDPDTEDNKEQTPHTDILPMQVVVDTPVDTVVKDTESDPKPNPYLGLPSPSSVVAAITNTINNVAQTVSALAGSLPKQIDLGTVHTTIHGGGGSYLDMSQHDKLDIDIDSEEKRISRKNIKSLAKSWLAIGADVINVAARLNSGETVADIWNSLVHTIHQVPTDFKNIYDGMVIALERGDSVLAADVLGDAIYKYSGVPAYVDALETMYNGIIGRTDNPKQHTWNKEIMQAYDAGLEGVSQVSFDMDPVHAGLVNVYDVAVSSLQDLVDAGVAAAQEGIDGAVSTLEDAADTVHEAWDWFGENVWPIHI